MSNGSPSAKFLRTFETVAVMAVELLLVVAVAVAILVLYVLFFNGLRTNLTSIDSASNLNAALQRVFSGVLVVLLGLELIETLKVFFTKHHVRTEVILIVAIIAVGRHILQLDFEHAGGLVLLGVAALIVSLALSYFLVKRADIQSDTEDQHGST